VPTKTKLAIYASVLALAQGAMAMLEAPVWSRLSVALAISVVATGQALYDLHTRNQEKAEALKTLQEEQAKITATRERMIRQNLRLWPAPTIAEVDPHDLGVKRSSLADMYREPGGIIAPYVMRDVDRRAAARLRASGLVLLVGVPASGVTRTAYELAHAAVPKALALAPSTPQGLRIALDSDVFADIPASTQVVLWLDQIDRFGREGVTTAMLRECRSKSAGIRIIATIRSGPRYAQWTALNADVANEFGQPVLLERIPSISERDRAAEIYQGIDFSEGIAAAFTVVAALLERKTTGNFECPHLSCPDDCAVSRAVVDIAMEWRRTGAARSLSITTLSKLVQQRLNQASSPDRAHLSDAIDWAATPLNEGAALLIVTPHEGEQAVVANQEVADVIASESEGPSTLVWSAALDDALTANDSDALGQIGFRAHTSGRSEIATRVWSAVASLDEPAARWLELAYEFSSNHRDAAGALSPAMRLLELAKADYGPTSLEASARLLAVGIVLRDMDRLEESISILKDALAIRESRLALNDPALIPILNSLGAAYLGLGQHAPAAALLERALAIVDAAGGTEITAATVLVNLGNVRAALGDVQNARKYCQAALHVLERAHGPDSYEVAAVRCNLANIHLELGSIDEARLLYEQALTGMEAVLGSDHVGVTSSLLGLGAVWKRKGRPDLALEHCQRALRIRRRLLGEESTLVADALSNVAGAHSALGHYDKALEIFHQALRIYERRFGADHPKLRIVISGIGVAYARSGRLAQARSHFELSLRLAEKYLSENDPALAIELDNLATTLLEQGHALEAKPHLVRALKVLHNRFPTGSPLTQKIVATLRALDPSLVILNNGEFITASEPHISSN
jgi:tetratricopeptide (TPR) repeat protein